jgi:Cof subfamily protein (haloacid dehalogenase superfamily)
MVSKDDKFQTGIVALATDLDGTLLGSDGSVPAPNIDALQRARTSGIPVFACTARSPRSTTKISKEAGLGPIAVCANGAIGYHVEYNSYLWHETLELEEVGSVIKAIRDTYPNSYFALEYGMEFYYEAGFFKDSIFIENVDIIESILSAKIARATKIVCRAEGITQDQLRETIFASATYEVSVSFGSIDWVEILPQGVSKGSGALKACEYLQIEPSSLACVGDHLNDLPMFEVSGLAIAVANAHPRTLKEANLVVSSNDDAGVAEVIERMLV